MGKSGAKSCMATRNTKMQIKVSWEICRLNLLRILFILEVALKGLGAWVADREVWYLLILETPQRLVFHIHNHV